MVNFKQLEALYWLRELGSFQRVADRIHVTQPAVAARIAMLEESTGVLLVDRSTSALPLTREGEAIANYAERLITIRDAMLESVKRDEKTMLRLAMVGPVAQTWGPDLRKLIAEHAPELRVEFTVGSTVQIERDVRAGTIDLAFMSLLHGDSLPLTPFSVEYEVGWMGTPEMVGRLPAPASMADIGRSELILYPPTSPLYSPVQSTLGERTANDGGRHFANSLSTILDMLRLGYGLSAIPVAVAKKDISAGVLMQVETTKKIKPLTVFCAHQARHRKATTDLLVELAKTAVQLQETAEMHYVGQAN
jgi:DNA-binding transcriptional LysR family regulator